MNNMFISKCSVIGYGLAGWQSIPGTKGITDSTTGIPFGPEPVFELTRYDMVGFKDYVQTTKFVPARGSLV